MGLQGQRYKKISRSPRIFRAAPPTIFQLSHSWLIYSMLQACSRSLQACFPGSLQACSRFASSVFPRFASSVFPRFASSVSGMSRHAAWNITASDWHCTAGRLRLNRPAIAAEPPVTVKHFSHSAGVGEIPMRRTVAPSHRRIRQVLTCGAEMAEMRL